MPHRSVQDEALQTAQEQYWKGEKGDEYQARNSGGKVGSVESNIDLFKKVLQCVPAENIGSLIEFGAGIGNNLRAWRHLLPACKLNAVEINEKAAAQIPRDVATHVGTFLVPLPPGPARVQYDMTMTKGALIHVAPEALALAYDNLYRLSRRYILICEYYSPTPRTIPYRDRLEILYLRDFAGELMDKYPHLVCKGYGFTWRKDTYPQDDVTTFLLEKVKP